jgi:hypothetical protein
MYVLQVLLERPVCVLTALGSQGLLRVVHCFFDCLGSMLIVCHCWANTNCMQSAFGSMRSLRAAYWRRQPS